MAFVPKLRTNPLVVVASLLAIVGIFCKRVQLLVGGFQIPNLDLSTVMTSSTVTHWEAGMQGAYPVSYTHLDVYKRQIEYL